MASDRRKPTYGAAIRFARIAMGLPSHPFGWTLTAIQNELDISARTLDRYIAIMRRELRDRRGRPLIEVQGSGSMRTLTVAQNAPSVRSTAYQAAALFFALRVLKLFEGTVLKTGVEDLWNRVEESLQRSERVRLRGLDRKFYAVPFAPKDYRAYDGILDLVLQALVREWRLLIDYAGIAANLRQHRFDPYTLVAHRGGLYLLGRSDQRAGVIYLAIERIEDVDFLRGEDGRPVKFALPRTYRPERYSEGVFGIIEGPETNVELLLLNPETEAYLRARRIHPSQVFERRRDGKTVLKMTVRGTTELANWILGLGPWVKVLQPPALRGRIAELHAQASRLYSD